MLSRHPALLNKTPRTPDWLLLERGKGRMYLSGQQESSRPRRDDSKEPGRDVARNPRPLKMMVAEEMPKS